MKAPLRTKSIGTGVYDFLYRKHDPSAGRWLSPDPAGWTAVDLTNPQSLNRYAYVVDNPLPFLDLFGLCYYRLGNLTIDSFTHLPVNGDNGTPCTPPPFNCIYMTNAEGDAYLGMTCTGNLSQWAITYGQQGSGGGGGGGGGAPNKPPLTPQQQQCVANAQADRNTATSRAWSDANDTFYETAGGAIAGGAIGGCVAGAVPTAGLGCVPGGLIGALGGLAGGVPTGIWLGSRHLHTALDRAQQDYNTAVQRCTQP